MSAAVIEDTPSTDDAMASPGETIKVEVKAAPPGLRIKLVNALAVVVAGVIALCVSAVLADGTSVIKLKDPMHLPSATAPHLRKDGVNYRLDELLGPTYGVGLHHDQSGNTWTGKQAGSTLKEIMADLGKAATLAAVPYVISTDDLKHPVPFLKCEELKMAGLCAASFGFIAEIVAVLMVIFHVLALAELIPQALVKPIGGLVWVTLTAGFMIVILLACGVYTALWPCDNEVVPWLRLADHFDYNYGFYFAILGFVCSLLIFVVVATLGGEAPPTKPGLKIGGGLIFGIVFCGVGAVSTLAATRTFSAAPAIDPDLNYCQGQKPKHAGPGDKYFSNVDCMKDAVTQTLEQAGANVTKGYKGRLDVGDRTPITGKYSDEGLCPVNVHWHLGAEHLSAGQFDEKGTGPAHRRELGTNIRQGFQCHHYKSSDPKFTKAYKWQYCTNMEVGQTYEIHWPHSAAGACGTKFQYQTPFYDGVFCKDGIIDLAPLNTYKKIGVQSQTFTIVNDEAYYDDDLFSGMIVDAAKNMGSDMAIYTGSTTGTSRDNSMCSRYTPITWQVDRKCHMISASSFDKMCKDMKQQADDMSGDVYPHGARTLVASEFAANNQQSRE